MDDEIKALLERVDATLARYDATMQRLDEFLKSQEKPARNAPKRPQR